MSFKHYNGAMAFNKMEVSANSGPEKIFDTTKLQYRKAKAELIDSLRLAYWTGPTSAADVDAMYSISCWLPLGTVGSTGGYNGYKAHYNDEDDDGGAVGTAFSKGNLNSTAALNPEMASYYADHQGDLDESLMRLCNEAMMRLNFKPPVDVPDPVLSRVNKYACFTSKNVMLTLNALYQKLNSNVGPNMFANGYYPLSMIPLPGAIRLIWVDILDTQRDAIYGKDPIFGINMNVLYPTYLKGWNMTIYEGMPVCYNYGTTDNWLGVASIDFTTTASSVTESGTTAEGAQNEGKFIRVERPSASNLAHLAGVVAGADHEGETGPKAIDIYIPNGAVVPVRCDVDTTTGVTILAMTSGEEELGFLAADSRPIALAMEDETALDGGTAATTLAKLDPNIFSFNYGTSGSAYTVTPGTYPVNYEYIEFTSTAPTIGFLQDNRLLSNATLTTGQLTVCNNYLHYTGSATAAGATYIRSVVNCVHLDANTNINGAGLIIAGSCCQVGGTPTAFTACNIVTALWVDTGLGTAPTAGNYCGMRLSNNGTAAMDSLISFYPGSCDYFFNMEHIPTGGHNSIVKLTGDHTYDANDYALKVLMNGTTYYIPMADATT